MKLREIFRCVWQEIQNRRVLDRTDSQPNRRWQERVQRRESALRPSETEPSAFCSEWCWKDSGTALGSPDWACGVRAHACAGRGPRACRRSPSYLIIGCHLSTRRRSRGAGAHAQIRLENDAQTFRFGTQLSRVRREEDLSPLFLK